LTVRCDPCAPSFSTASQIVSALGGGEMTWSHMGQIGHPDRQSRRARQVALGLCRVQKTLTSRTDPTKNAPNSSASLRKRNRCPSSSEADTGCSWSEPSSTEVARCPVAFSLPLWPCCWLPGGCAKRPPRLTPDQRIFVEVPASESGVVEPEDEMDITIPAFDPLTAADPMEQVKARFRGTDRRGRRRTSPPARRKPSPT
jgi:hypothetical protein